MKLTYVARQPIINLAQKTYGYELLFRASEENYFPNVDGDFATANLIVQNHFIGDIKTLCHNKKAFINFNQNAIISNYPLFFDNRDIVVEVIETVTMSDEIAAKLVMLGKKGYTIALDDFDICQIEDYIALLPYISIIKVDIQQFSVAQIASFSSDIKSKYPCIQLLAEKVESNDEYLTFADLGFTLFQGYFFAKPEIVKRHSSSPIAVNTINLLKEVSCSEVDLKNVASIISIDVQLTMSLLKIVNNAATGLKVEISDIKQAVSYIGENKLREFVLIILVSKLSQRSYEELLVTSLVTAKSMEQIAQYLKCEELSNVAFLTGLLSTVDKMLQIDLCDILRSLPLSGEVKEALSHRQGLLGNILKLAIVVESAKKEEVVTMCDEYGLKLDDMFKIKMNSHQWAMNVSSSLSI